MTFLQLQRMSQLLREAFLEAQVKRYSVDSERLFRVVGESMHEAEDEISDISELLGYRSRRFDGSSVKTGEVDAYIESTAYESISEALGGRITGGFWTGIPEGRY